MEHERGIKSYVRYFVAIHEIKNLQVYELRASGKSLQLAFPRASIWVVLFVLRVRRIYYVVDETHGIRRITRAHQQQRAFRRCARMISAATLVVENLAIART